MSKSSPITDPLRRAIRKSGLSHYRIAKEAGLQAGQLDRFMSGERDLMAGSADRLAAYFGLELRPTAPRRKAKP